LRLFSFGGYGLALAALALVVFGAIECPPLNRKDDFFKEREEAGKLCFFPSYLLLAQLKKSTESIFMFR